MSDDEIYEETFDHKLERARLNNIISRAWSTLETNYKNAASVTPLQKSKMDIIKNMLLKNHFETTNSELLQNLFQLIRELNEELLTIKANLDPEDPPVPPT